MSKPCRKWNCECRVFVQRQTYHIFIRQPIFQEDQQRIILQVFLKKFTLLILRNKLLTVKWKYCVVNVHKFTANVQKPEDDPRIFSILFLFYFFLNMRDGEVNGALSSRDKAVASPTGVRGSSHSHTPTTFLPFTSKALFLLVFLLKTGHTTQCSVTFISR